MYHVTIEPSVGSDIGDSIDKACEIADAVGNTVVLMHNDVKISISPGDDPQAHLDAFMAR